MYQFLKPLLFRLEPETAHHLAMMAASWGALAPNWAKPSFVVEDERLHQDLFGLQFKTPVGLAAGFDKNAAHIDFWPSLGFGFMEIGSVTAKPSAGNPKPRAFRLPDDEALINRMGLNNDGARVVAKQIAAFGPTAIPLGINIAKTHDPDILEAAAIQDFVASFRHLAPYAGYVTLNISCPNTAEGKTFEDPTALDQLLKAIFDVRTSLGLQVPVLVKISPPASLARPDFAYVDDLLAVIGQYPLAGLMATNTASDRSGLRTPISRLSEIGRGGLSGKPLAQRSTALIRTLYQKTAGQMPIIGLGGILCAEDAFEKIKAGASLLQVYTGLVYQGPRLISDIHKGLLSRLDQNGFNHLREAIGIEA